MQQTLTKPIAYDDKKSETIPNTTTPDELIFTAHKKITISCGKSLIMLYPNGKIVIKGEYIISDAEGVNRLSGGRIEVN